MCLPFPRHGHRLSQRAHPKRLPCGTEGHSALHAELAGLTRRRADDTTTLDAADDDELAMHRGICRALRRTRSKRTDGSVSCLPKITLWRRSPVAENPFKTIDFLHRMAEK